ncbi:MAG: 30S ribosomal protein S16 [Patescibacteria group bacterium]
MLKIRLQRIGKRGQAHFRVVIQEHTEKAKGKSLELLGSYNPHQKVLNVQKERIEYWMSKGAQISPTVNNLMVNYKVWDRPKMISWKPKKKEGGAPTEAAAPAPAAEQASGEAQPEAQAAPAQ